MNIWRFNAFTAQQTRARGPILPNISPSILLLLGNDAAVYTQAH
jgi:hypothetical protein